MKRKKSGGRDGECEREGERERFCFFEVEVEVGERGVEKREEGVWVQANHFFLCSFDDVGEKRDVGTAPAF